MKLLSLSAFCFSAAYSLNVDTFLEKAIESIYTEHDNGFDISLHPYYVTEFRAYHNKAVSKGYYGNGNGQIETETTATWNADFTQVKYEYEESGTISSAPLHQYLMAPYTWNQEFTGVYKAELLASEMKVEWSEEGSIGSKKYALKASAGVEDFNQKRDSTDVSLGFDTECNTNMNNPFQPAFQGLFQCPNVDVSVTLGAQNVCAESPFNAGCKMNFGWSGEVNGADVDAVDFTWTAKKDSSKIVVDCASSGVYQLRAKYNNMKYFTVEFKQNAQEWIHIITVAGPKNWQAVVDSVMQFVQPFEQYLNHGVLSLSHNSALSVVWVDRAFNKLTNEFDCSAIVKATMFNSEILNISPRTLKEACIEGNKIAIASLQDFGNEHIAKSRNYVHGLTDAKNGGKKFNKWYKSVKAQ